MFPGASLWNAHSPFIYLHPECICFQQYTSLAVLQVLSADLDIIFSNRNENQELLLLGKGGRCVLLTTLPPSRACCLEIWDLQPPGTPRASNRPVQLLLYILYITGAWFLFSCCVDVSCLLKGMMSIFSIPFIHCNLHYECFGIASA